jgi:pseudouridylate synthase / pseudouridine kinase
MVLRYGTSTAFRLLVRRVSPRYGRKQAFTRSIHSRSVLPDNPFFKISEEIREALHSRRPIVALETTIYTHGFPYPDNVALASELESIVRSNGGVPATIGILDGVARVGLSPEELIRLASSAGQPSTLKLSRRDLSYACGLRLNGKLFNGGTTIAATMILAHMAGIKVFATGGLGGVHRGGESSMDVSADLTELGRTPVAIISSGCKSFLDIPRTLEYLETQGVGVATFARGRGSQVDFPAFWSRESGVKSPMVVQTEKEAAAMICKLHIENRVIPFC